jgi:hypothetical protein
MSIQSILWPVFIQIALVYGLSFMLVRARLVALKHGEAKIKDVAATTQAWPQRAKNIGAAFDNQFQMPVLFCVLVILALITRKADLLFVIMEWVFVILRVLQAYIHTTSNVLIWRFRFFVSGTLLLFAMWIIFALRILNAPAVVTL